jgi:hypothetical protein
VENWACQFGFKGSFKPNLRMYEILLRQPIGYLVVLVLGFFQRQRYHNIEIIIHGSKHSAIVAARPSIHLLHGAKLLQS